MSPPVRLLAPLLLAAAVVLASGCKGKGVLGGSSKAPPEGPPTFEALLAIDSGEPLANEIIDQLERRVEKLEFNAEVGTAGPGETSKVKVYLYAASEPEARKQLEALSNSGRLEFRKVHPRNDQVVESVMAGDSIEPDYTPFEHKWTDDEGTARVDHLLLTKKSSLIGADINKAFPDTTRAGLIQVQLTSKGGKKMQRLTAPMTKGVDRLAIVLNGEVMSAPVVQDTLSTRFVITGIDGDEERERLCSSLMLPLMAELTVESLTAVPAPTP